MAKFVLPKLKKSKDNKIDTIAYDPLTEDSWARRIQMPVDKGIIGGLNVDDTVDVKLVGRVIGLETRENDKKTPRYSLEIELVSVEAYPQGNEFSELADDDD